MSLSIQDHCVNEARQTHGVDYPVSIGSPYR